MLMIDLRMCNFIFLLTSVFQNYDHVENEPNPADLITTNDPTVGWNAIH
jgi:hypothetical protein